MPRLLDPIHVLNHWCGDPRQEPIVLSIDRYSAFTLVAQLQLALRHPDNVGEAAGLARHFVEQLQSVMPDEVRELSRMGDDVPGDPTRQCRQCGCTDDRACMVDGRPCQWVERTLCSACAPTIILP